MTKGATITTKEAKHPAKNNIHYCPICSKTIAGNYFKFKAHMYTHNEVKSRFTCRYCPKEFYRKDTYDVHQRTHEAKGAKKMPQANLRKLFICDICNQSFSFKYCLIIHLKTHDPKFQPKCETFPCKICDKVYCEYRLFLRHVRKTHFNFQGKESLHGDKLPNGSWVEPVKQTDVYVEMTKLTDNVIVIKRIAQIKNEATEVKDDKDEIGLKNIFDNKTGCYSKVVCNYCNKEMLRKSLLNHIRERHLYIKPFKCNQCGYDFNRRYQLINHVCGHFTRRSRRV